MIITERKNYINTNKNIKGIIANEALATARSQEGLDACSLTSMSRGAVSMF